MFAFRCFSGDYLKMFLHLDSEGVNESTPWNSLICGERSNQTFFSASRHLVIQFHAGHALPSHSQLSAKSTGPLGLGFHGFFRFLDSSKAIFHWEKEVYRGFIYEVTSTLWKKRASWVQFLVQASQAFRSNPFGLMEYGRQ